MRITKKAKFAKSSAKDATGTYIYDKNIGKVVRVSAGVPKVASKGRSSGGSIGPCGRERGSCGSGSCS